MGNTVLKSDVRFTAPRALLSALKYDAIANMNGVIAEEEEEEEEVKQEKGNGRRGMRGWYGRGRVG
jgi:hypothetical protein